MPFHYGVMNDKEERKKKNKINIYEVRFSNSDKGWQDFASSFTLG